MRPVNNFLRTSCLQVHYRESGKEAASSPRFYLETSRKTSRLIEQTLRMSRSSATLRSMMFSAPYHRRFLKVA